MSETPELENAKTLEDVDELLREVTADIDETTVESNLFKIYVKTSDEFTKMLVEAIQGLDQFESAGISARFPPLEPRDGEMLSIREA